jgi:hypothetical protein
MAQQLDRTRVEGLANNILGPVKDELARQPYTRDNVYVVLNVLAYCVAVIFAGTEDHPQAHRFFNNALVENVADLAKQMGEGHT